MGGVWTLSGQDRMVTHSSAPDQRREKEQGHRGGACIGGFTCSCDKMDRSNLREKSAVWIHGWKIYRPSWWGDHGSWVQGKDLGPEAEATFPSL